MNIYMMIFLRVAAVYLAISIFNCINFVRAADTVIGRKSPWNWRKLHAVVKFGFGWKNRFSSGYLIGTLECLNLKKWLS